MGFEARKDDLITEQPHWQIAVKNSEVIARKFCSALKKASVYVD